MQRPTRFAKMNLRSLSTANLSVCDLSKPKLHARASHKAMAEVQFGFGEVVRA